MTWVLPQNRFFWLGSAWSQGRGSGRRSCWGDKSQLSFPWGSPEANARTQLLCQQDFRNFLALLGSPVSILQPPSRTPQEDVVSSREAQNGARFVLLPIFQLFTLNLQAQFCCVRPCRRPLLPLDSRYGTGLPVGCGWQVVCRAGCFPHHTCGNQSPAHKGPALGWGFTWRVWEGRSPVSLFKCWPICWLGGTHSLVAAAAVKSYITLMSIPSITIALIFDTWREDAPAREEFIKNTPPTRHQREPQRDSELEQRTKTFTEVLRRKKGKGKNHTNNSNKVSYKTRIKRHCWGKDDDSKKHQELRTQLANQIYTDSPWYLPTNRLSCRTSKKFKRLALQRWARSERAAFTAFNTDLQVLHQWDCSEARGLGEGSRAAAGAGSSPPARHRSKPHLGLFHDLDNYWWRLAPERTGWCPEHMLPLPLLSLAVMGRHRFKSTQIKV